MNKVSRLLKYFTLLFVTILLFGCVNETTTTQNITTAPQNTTTTTQNITTTPQIITTTSSEDTSIVVDERDYVIRTYLDGVEIIAYTGSARLIQLPTEINGLTVLRVGNYAFYRNTMIETVYLPETIKEIGDFSFSDATNLKILQLPKSLESIGEDIIQNCSSLTEINVAADNSFFYSLNGILFRKIVKSSLAKLSYNPNPMTNDDDDSYELFLYPQGKTETYFEIDDGIQAIGNFAFSGNQYLTEIVIPNSVLEIGMGAFMNCTSLVTLAIPENVRIIPDFMCFGCIALTNLTLSEGLISIMMSAFQNCTSLSLLDFPSSLTEISLLAFYNIGNIQEVYLHDELLLYGGSVFASNQSFTSFIVDASNTNYQVVDGVLYSADLSKLVAYPSGKAGSTYEVILQTTEILNGAFQGNYYLETITFAGDVSTIRLYAFSECHSLKSFMIPQYVQELSHYAFYGTMTIEEFTVHPDNIYFESIDDVVFTEDLTILCFYPSAKLGTVYDLPETVTRINTLAFYKNQHLEVLNISKNLETVGGGAISAMNSLIEINVVPENDYFASVDGVLFSHDLSILYCVPSGLNIATYTIPASVISIDHGAFQGNPYLIYLIIPSTVEAIMSHTFRLCENLAWVVIPTSVTVIEHRLFLESSNVSIYFLGFEEDYVINPAWNLENRPYYFSGEWQFSNAGVPELVNP
ncbi:MAG: leucine-rich repeat protein [Candidatus Izemoplasmatales bacterium]|jgi:hypothetical protein